MKAQYRVKEVAVNKDGTNIWYYPEISFPEAKKKGILWWEKEIIVEYWERFFYMDDAVIHLSDWAEKNTAYQYLKKEIVGFRSLEQAQSWLKNWKTKFEDECKQTHEAYYKKIASYVKEDYKTHEL